MGYKFHIVHKRLISIFSNMRDRCKNPKNTHYNVYGGKGVRVCEEWLTNRDAFITWALSNGYADDLQLDRIDNDGNYEPANCRWVTPKENCRNTSKNVFIEYNGERKTMTEWCELLNLDYSVVSNRIQRGWRAEKAFEPIRNIGKTERQRKLLELKKQLNKGYGYIGIAA